MKVMVCLISDQHVPNLLTVHAIEPDLLILLETPAMKVKRGASNLIRALRIGSSKKPICKIKSLNEENSIEATKKLLGTLISKYPDAEWTVNITGGTKPMSIAAYEFFKGKNAKILYVPIIAQRRAINFADNSLMELKYELKVKEFLAGYGFDYFKKEDVIREGEKRAEKLFELAVNLSANIDIAHKIMADLDKRINEVYGDNSEKARSKAKEKGITLVDLEIENQMIRDNISSSFGLNNNGGLLNGLLKRHAVQFLTGGWLEAFIWGILTDHSRNLGIIDVRLGIHPRKKLDLKMQKKEVKNDWDIAFMYNQSLRFVECKTGDQEHDPSGNETLYKVEAVKRQLGALNIKSYLATTSPNVLKGNDIRDAIADRAELYNCTVIPSMIIRSLAEMKLNKDPEIVKKLSELFMLERRY